MKILYTCALPEESNWEEKIGDDKIIWTGIGKIAAGYKTALAISEHKPDLVCNFGGCGSFKYDPGKILCVDSVYNGDMDAEPISPYSITPFDIDGGQLHLLHKEELSEPRVTCFTSETFITKDKLKHFSTNKLNLLNECDIFEMELYSIVRVCKELGVPVVSYKWVSDNADANDWTINYKIGYNLFKEIIVYG